MFRRDTKMLLAVGADLATKYFVTYTAYKF